MKGEWTFQFWHEETGYLDEVTRDGKTISWKRGRADIVIEPGNNDLGEIKIKPAVFSN